MSSWFGEAFDAAQQQADEEEKLRQIQQQAQANAGDVPVAAGQQPFYGVQSPAPSNPTPPVGINPNQGGFRDPVYNPANVEPGPNADPFQYAGNVAQPFIDTLQGAMNIPLYNSMLPTPGGGQAGTPTTVGDIYNADVPVYSDFARNTLVPAAESVGQTVGDPFGVGDITSSVAGALVPVSGGDLFTNAVLAGGPIEAFTGVPIDDLARGAARTFMPEPSLLPGYSAGIPPMHPNGGERVYGQFTGGASPEDAAIFAQQAEAAKNYSADLRRSLEAQGVTPPPPDVPAPPAFPEPYPSFPEGTMGEVFPDMVNTRQYDTEGRLVTGTPKLNEEFNASPAARMGAPLAYDPQFMPPPAGLGDNPAISLTPENPNPVTDTAQQMRDAFANNRALEGGAVTPPPSATSLPSAEGTTAPPISDDIAELQQAQNTARGESVLTGGGGGVPPTNPPAPPAAAATPPPNGPNINFGTQGTTTTGIPNAPAIQQQAQAAASQMGVPPTVADRVVQNWLDNGQITQDYLKNPNVVARTASALEGAVTGNYTDSFIAGLVQRQGELEQALQRTGLSPADIKARVDAATASRIAEHYQGDATKIAAAQQVLKDADTKAASLAKDLRQTETLWDRVKNTLFPFDLGFGGVNILTGVRQGGVQTVAGMANRVALALNMPFATNLEATTGLPRILAASNDGLNLGRTASGLNPDKGSLLRYIPVAKEIDKVALTPVINALTDAQYKGLGGFLKMMNYEGNLTMLAATGKDISDPAVRREAARVTNNAWSSAATATTPGRAQLERLSLTSPAFTRSQVGQITDMAKLITPGANETQRILAAGAILSNVVMIAGVYKVLNDQFGIGDAQLDPTKPGFGNITLPTTNSNGKHQVINLFPQRSFQTAAIRAVDAIKNKDVGALEEAGARLGAGRSSWLIGTPARAAGFGYDSQGKFYTGGMPIEERVKATIPVPVSLQNLAFGGGTDPLTLGLEATGVTNYPESTGAQMFRESQDVNRIREGILLDNDVLKAAFPNHPEIAQDIRGASWNALTAEEKQSLIAADRKAHPEHGAALDQLEATRKQYQEEKPSAIGNAIRIQQETDDKIGGIRKDYGVQFDKIGEKFINGLGNPRELRQTLSALREQQNQDIAVERWKGGTTYAGLPETEGKGMGRLPNEVQQAISAYYDIGNNIPRIKGEPNYDAIQQARDGFIVDLYRSSPNTASRLDFYLSQRKEEAEAQKSEFIQYWDSKVIPSLERYYDVPEGGRTAWRREHPMDDALLTFAGYMPSTVSPLAGQLLQGLAPGRGVK